MEADAFVFLFPQMVSPFKHTQFSTVYSYSCACLMFVFAAAVVFVAHLHFVSR